MAGDQAFRGEPALTGLAVVVPVKGFHDAKQRLRPAIGDDQRAALARHLADGVAAAITSSGATFWVACDDDEVRRWAEAAGARIAWTPDEGLNGAISIGVRQAVDHGATHVIVSHADLARPASLTDVAGEGTITLVPDRHGDGTNVMSFPADAVIEPAYGPASFGRHLATAQSTSAATGSRLRVLATSDLGLDVDTLHDLQHPAIREVLPPWLRIHPDNRSTPDG